MRFNRSRKRKSSNQQKQSSKLGKFCSVPQMTVNDNNDYNKKDEAINKTKKVSKTTNCQNCSKILEEYEIFEPSNCTHKFCSKCLQMSGYGGHYHCPSCQVELFWFQQTISGHRFFLGEFDPLRASLVETINHCEDLILEFQTNIIQNFNTVDNHNTQMLTRLYICLKSLQSSMLWDEIHLFKIDMSEEDSAIMLDMYWALSELSECDFDDTTGAEKHNIIDDINDNIPYIIWLRNHLMKLEKFLDPLVLSVDKMKRIKSDKNINENMIH